MAGGWQCPISYTFYRVIEMEYVSSVERIGIRKGIQQEALKLLSLQIARRFRVSSDSVQPIFAGLTTEQLEELGQRFFEAEKLDQIREWANELRQGQ